MERTGAFPAGLFWLHRGEEPPLPRVIQLLTHAAVAGVESALVMVDNFDEALRDLVRLVKGIDTTVLDTFAVERNRWSGAPYPGGRRGWPVVRHRIELHEEPELVRCAPQAVHPFDHSCEHLRVSDGHPRSVTQAISRIGSPGRAYRSAVLTM